MSQPDGRDAAADAQYQRSVVWGTDINIQEVNDKFTRFLREFKAKDTVEPKYLVLLDEVRTYVSVSQASSVPILDSSFLYRLT